MKISAITHLRCETKENPLGIDALRPRLSWQLHSDGRNAMQSAYQIQVAGSTQQLAADDLLWDSGRMASDQSVHIPYEGPQPTSGQRFVWRVRVWDGGADPSAWSAPAYWEMGLLSSDDWQAQWITPTWAEEKSDSPPAPYLRTEFATADGLVSARLYITALGLYEARLNGQRVGDQLFTPGWTSYDHRLQVQSYDVTARIQPGANALGVILGDGWYRGYLGFGDKRNVYGDTLGLLCQLHLVYADGSSQIVTSGDGWQASTGPILASDLYNGERYDARLEMTGWDRVGFDQTGWSPVRPLERPTATLIAPAGPPVKAIEEIRPIQILTTPQGETVADFGQNMVGWVRLTVSGPAGTTVTLRHFEVLDKEGNVYTENLRAAKQTVTYTLSGDGVEVYTPRFTFQGFQYVAVDGYPGELTPDSLTGVVIHSAMQPTGHFECSHPLLNQLQHNILWGQKGNFLDVPTDCPQRDERLGWTGDAQVFMRTAAFNMDVAAFFTKWLGDLAADQDPNGSVPFVVPEVLRRTAPPEMQAGGFSAYGSSAWGDAATICPWTLYLCYGDTRILEAQYASMAGWVQYMADQAGENYIWDKGFHFGDWLAMESQWKLIPFHVTSREMIATAYFAHSTNLLRQAAQVLGREADVQKYGDLHAHIKAAFQKEFVTPAGRIDGDTQTAYALALMFDLLPEELRAGAAQRLAEDIRKKRTHIASGFVGTSYLCHVLSRFGQLDVAYDLLLQEDFPSWLYPVKQGATTIWERWDGLKPDGSFQDAGMNSFNHYAYGAIGDWMVRVVAGLDTDSAGPGYKQLLVQPQPGGGLTHAQASLETFYGLAKSGWEKDEAGITYSVTVAPNTQATVHLPGVHLAQITENGQPLAAAPGIHAARQVGDDVVVVVGSGQYQFRCSVA